MWGEGCGGRWGGIVGEGVFGVNEKTKLSSRIRMPRHEPVASRTLHTTSRWHSIMLTVHEGV